MSEDEGLVLDIIGPERGGKSDFATSISLYDTSGPTTYFAFDHNYKAAVARHRRLGAKIQVEEFFYSLPYPPPTSPKEKDFEKRVNAVAQAVRPIWTRFKEVLWKALRGKGPLVLDQMTTIHYVCRLALYGYVHKIPPPLYAKRTNEMNTILNEIRYSNKNVAMIHRWKETWKNNVPTGKFERDAAYAPVAYEVAATLEAERLDSGIFAVRIKDSMHSADLVGRRFSGEKRTFARVARRLLEEPK